MPCPEAPAPAPQPPAPAPAPRPPAPAPPPGGLVWSYGVTTCPERRDTLLPRTLASLAAAGFDAPRLFVDGEPDAAGWRREFGRDVTARYPRVRAYANWILSLWELYARQPGADRYALFQDDFVCVRGLRAYLDACPYPERSYLNLYLFPSNEAICPVDERGRKRRGWYPANGLGKGAVALVFDRAAVVALLSSPGMVRKPQDAGRGHKSIDGAVVTALKQVGYREMCHYPSLTQHLGAESTVGNPKHLQAPSFPGEAFDAMTLLAPVQLQRG